MRGGHITVEGEAHVLNHLSGIDLSDEDASLAFCRLAQGIVREGPERDRAEQPGIQPLFARLFYRFLRDTCRAANATMRYSASSHHFVPYLTSRFLISAYFS